jgi:peptidoglycan/LPS O-acetylase OafA/YrhL
MTAATAPAGRPVATSSSLSLVDTLKAFASQLIVWHHLAFYGPMSDVARPHAPGLLGWLADDARIAVQVFLVVAGFLAARSLLERSRIDLPRLVWQRYLRLVRPYAVALVVAVLAAWAARQLVPDHPDAPAAPTAGQLLAHLFMLQDIAGIDALSAGVWYVAIDLQLYALLAGLLWLSQRAAGLALPVVAAVMLLSLLWLNRQPELDVWAPYFFGAYGLGVLAYWMSQRPRRLGWAALLAGVVLLALAFEWRSRILVAGVTAVALVLAADLRHPGGAVAAALARISYPVFLIHYPVCLVMGAAVLRFWPDSVAVNVLGMVAAWLLSLAAGALLQRWLEPPVQARAAA